MIKIDKLKWKSELKKKLKIIILLAMLVSGYSIITLILAKLNIKKKHLYTAYAIVIIGSLLWICLGDYSIVDLVLSYTSEYLECYFLIDPVRLIMTSLFGIFFNETINFLGEGIDDWVVEEKKKQLDSLLPKGQFNYKNRSHTLVLGTSGSGKGVMINHLLKYNFEQNHRIIMISAKLAHTDNYSQLAYCRKLAAKHNRPLYVVSMDENVTDRYQYNPLKYIAEEEMLNALKLMIEIESSFYRNSFIAWIINIYDLLKKAGEEVTFAKLLKLYEYDQYISYVRQLHDDGKINDEQKEYFQDIRIQKYATNAENDSANFELVLRSGKNVLNKTPNGKKISIIDAFEDNAVLYFDLNGNSAAAATMLIGCCILAEMQYATKIYADADDFKTVICDEASFYISEVLVSLFNESRSAGYQMVLATQGFSDIENKNSVSNILGKLKNNTNQFCFLRLNAQEDADEAGELIGTTLIAENTRRAESIDYDEMGSLKATPAMIANPNTLKNLNNLETIYYEKKENDDHEPHPVLLKWRTDDL